MYAKVLFKKLLQMNNKMHFFFKLT